jgi:hypothetical protein
LQILDLGIALKQQNLEGFDIIWKDTGAGPADSRRIRTDANNAEAACAIRVG